MQQREKAKEKARKRREKLGASLAFQEFKRDSSEVRSPLCIFPSVSYSLPWDTVTPCGALPYRVLRGMVINPQCSVFLVSVPLRYVPLSSMRSSSLLIPDIFFPCVSSLVPATDSSEVRSPFVELFPSVSYKFLWGMVTPSVSPFEVRSPLVELFLSVSSSEV